MNGHLERPLRLGEIFDRAVTISVRGCLPLFVLFALYDLPMGVLQLFGATRVDHFVGIIVAAVLDRVYEISGIGAQNAGPTTIDNVVLIVGLLLQPLLSGAIAFAVMRGLAGESMQPALAYRAAFARYGQLLGVFAISTASLGIIFVVASASVAWAALLFTHGIVVASLIVFVWVVFLAIVLSWCSLVLTLALNSVVLDNASVFRAMNNVRVLISTRREFGRMLVTGLVLIAIQVAAHVAGETFGELFYSLVPLFFAYEMIDYAVIIVGSILPSVVGTLYYLDLRVRREGRNMLDEPPVLASTVPV